MYCHRAVLLCVALLAGCAAEPRRSALPSAAAPASPGVLADDNLNAVAWTQTAVEHDLIYLEIYRDAQTRLLPALQDGHWDALSRQDRVAPAAGLPPAVILDIDETVLDNSPFQARVIKGGGEYDEAAWRAWCLEARARALPGAVAFTQFAARHGIAVIYLSNRASNLDRATLANLRQAGFPVGGPDAFLGLGSEVAGCVPSGSAKGCRRQQVSRRYRVLMQFGDQLGDFLDTPDASLAGRRGVVQPYLPWIGTRWFVFPNPTYGSWESALYGDKGHESPDMRRQQKRDALYYH